MQNELAHLRKQIGIPSEPTECSCKELLLVLHYDRSQPAPVPETCPQRGKANPAHVLVIVEELVASRPRELWGS
jgi:hypothetical protein